MFSIIFYVPKEYSERVKEAMFKSGAGTLGNYSHCSFESKGVGQFKPLQNSRPFLGVVGQVEKVEEIKVEMICRELSLFAAISALKEAHPYETPAYYVIKTVEI